MYLGLNIPVPINAIHSGEEEIKNYLFSEITRISRADLLDPEKRALDEVAKLLLRQKGEDIYLDYSGRSDAGLVMQAFDNCDKNRRDYRCAVTGLFDRTLFLLCSSISHSRSAEFYAYEGPAIRFSYIFADCLLKVARKEKNILTTKIY